MRRWWMREAGGWLAALALAAIVTGQVAASARAELIFRDGDSLIVAMFSRAILGGTATDWAMSSVLFLPESAVFAAMSAVLPFGVDGILVVSAVANLLALYGAIRLAAGRARPAASPVAWSLAAFAVFGMLAVTDVSSSRDALDLASLQLTTTYYSATVVATVLAVGIVRRSLDRARISAQLLVALGAVAVVSTLSNPLFAVWATVPLTIVLLICSIRSPHRLRMLSAVAVLVGGSAGGVVARIPFAAWITNSGAGYAQPELWMQSIEYYARLLAQRVSTPIGVVGALLVLALLGLAVQRSFRTTGAAEPDGAGTRFVALAAWVVPTLVVIGAIALGTHAARYLQPVAFAPVLALVAAPQTLALSRRVARQLGAALAVLLVIGAALSVPRATAAATEPDPDRVCVTDWIDASGRTGAGQFWTVRLPKLHLGHPSQLVQVDHQLHGYAWLVDRHDLDVGTVSFLVEDAQTVPWELPVAAVPDQIIDCGRYRIIDFGDAALPLGPSHG